MRPALLIPVIVTALATTAAAQVPPPSTAPHAPDTVAADTARPPDNALSRLFLEEEIVVRIGLGTGTYPAEPKLPDVTGSTMFQLGVSVPFRSLPLFGLELEYFGGRRTFSTEGSEWWIFTAEGETRLSTHWINLAGRLNLPPSGPLRAYGSAGLAAALVELRTDGTVLGFPSTVQSDSDEAITPVLGAGLQVVLGAAVLHLDYRWSSLTVDFDDYGLPGVETGGSFLFFGAGIRGTDWVPGSD